MESDSTRNQACRGLQTSDWKVACQDLDRLRIPIDLLWDIEVALNDMERVTHLKFSDRTIR